MSTKTSSGLRRLSNVHKIASSSPSLCFFLVLLQSERFTNLLSELRAEPGNFATDGILTESPNPGLNIDGLGPISLPLCQHTAKQIIEVARQAPFGLGEKTVVDENVRLVLLQIKIKIHEYEVLRKGGGFHYNYTPSNCMDMLQSIREASY